MIVRRTLDGTFTIVGITYAALEDLVSAYDGNVSFYRAGDDFLDLYDDQDQIEPLRQALLSANAGITDSEGEIVQNSPEWGGSKTA